MDESSEQEVKTSDDQAEGSGAQSGHLHMDEELDGAPVFGTDEDEWEMDSSFNQKVSSQLDRNSDDDEDKVNKNKSQDGTPIINANAENSSSTIASLMDEEQTKASEESSVTPPSDPVIDIQVTQPQVEIRMPQRYVSKEPPVQSKETHYSPIIQIKDEPIDEDYDKALLPQSYTSNVKQEMESNENEADAPSDELRISSVFSVRGNNSDAVTASVASAQPSSFPVITQSTSLRGTIVLPAQTQPQFHLRLQPRAHMPPQMQTLPRMQQPMLSQAPVQHPAPPQVHAPPPTVRICCSGCSKVLQKGQTAFQRKGSNQLFCSTVCLTSFSLPSVQFTPIIAPKKTCHLCLKVIVNLKDLITIPVGPMNTLKEFCSPICLNIYKDRYEDASAEVFTQCSVCKLVKEIQHEVTHLGVVHKLCSDECFARFRSSRNLYMSYCENCGNCTASGNYHLVQIEDSIRKFCTTECISTYKQKSGKRLPCPYCQEIKNIDQMTDGTNIQGVTEFFCSQRCVALSQASPSLTGTSFPCTSCKNVAVPQYHLAISDGSIRNFCSLDCVGKFQDKMNASAPHNQINGNSHEPQNVAPSQPPTEQHPPTQTSSSSVSGQNQNPIPPYVPAPGLENSQDTMQQGLAKTPSASSKISLTCKQCNVQFSGKPEVFQYKGHSGVFCTRACCEVYKRESNVKAVCEYCKQDKVIKDIITYEKQLRYFCCEGCKLLFKHDLAKRQGVQFRFCVNCQNMTHKTVQNFFGGKLEEFCTEDCMSQYTVLFYEMAKCYGCKQQGALKESLMLYGSKKHFCDSNCLMRFCLKGLTFRQPRNSMMQFCSKAVAIPQPTNNTVSNTTTVQAPLSVSKNMPVIGGVVSLASTLPANTAVTGALPTSNASSKNIGEASTQTDAAVPGTPHRRMLKNKALMCRPITEEQGVQCQPEPPIPSSVSETVIYENGEKVRLVPFPVPIPMPVYIPVPMHLYTQYTPFPVGLPLPVPVPVVIPGSQDAAESEDHKSSLPAQSSVEDDEGDKGKDKPVSQDQGSTYSGDVESDARSTPFSWADNDEPGASGKQLNPSSELEEPQAARATSVSPEHPDLEDDFPRSSTDPGSAKDSRLLLTLKRRRKGRDGFPVKKRTTPEEEETTTTEDSRIRVDCKEADERQTQSSADLTMLTSSPPIASCHPERKLISPSDDVMRNLLAQCRGRPDRFGVLLFRAVIPKRIYTKYVSVTNWDGSRGKFALPINLRNFIIKTVSKKFPNLTIGDQKRIKDRINEFLRSPRNGSRSLKFCEEAAETTPEEEEEETEDSQTQLDCEDADSVGQTLTPPTGSCNPDIEFTSPSEQELKNLITQCHGRPDRFGVLLFRAVVPKQQHAEWVWTTNWDGSRGKLALPVNLRNFIIEIVSKKFPSLTVCDQKCIKNRINEILRAPRFALEARRTHFYEEGRKRSGTDTSGSVWLSTSSSKLNQVYGVAAWASWVKTKTGQTSDEDEQQSSGRMLMKEDVLQCSSAELSYGLCRFIREVRRPNGEVYEPDSVYYLCLGIQQCLLENGRLENIFTDSLYSEFISEITALLKDWSCTLPSGGYVNSRVEEEYLWECKQLGALSPIVLLNTLLFFGAKMLNLKTVEQHQRLTFSNVTQCSKTTKNGMSSYLRFKLPNKEEVTDRRVVKRRREEEKVDEEVMEMPENSENPLRCPVRLYQFYLSKCSNSVKQRPDLFYLQPESSCHPSSPVWYSAQPLDTIMMESMLTRIIVIRDIHLDFKQQKYPDSSEEESSQ